MIKWEIETTSRANITVKAYYTIFDNGLLVFLTDSDEKISSIAIGTPVPQMVARSGTSSTPIIFGTKNSLITKAIAEKIARNANKIAILILHFKTEEQRELMNLAARVIDQVLQKQEVK